MKFRFKNAPNMSVKTRAHIIKSLRIADTVLNVAVKGIVGTMVVLVGICVYKAIVG